MTKADIKLIEIDSILNLPIQEKRCPDYDEDCLSFTPYGAWRCWIGGYRFIQQIDEWVYTDQAGGYCPIVHHSSQY